VASAWWLHSGKVTVCGLILFFIHSLFIHWLLLCVFVRLCTCCCSAVTMLMRHYDDTSCKSFHRQVITYSHCDILAFCYCPIFSVICWSDMLLKVHFHIIAPLPMQYRLAWAIVFSGCPFVCSYVCAQAGAFPTSLPLTSSLVSEHC